jgi:hypothetical protein
MAKDRLGNKLNVYDDVIYRNHVYRIVKIEGKSVEISLFDELLTVKASQLEKY